MSSNPPDDTSRQTAREKAALEEALGTLDTIADGGRRPASYAELKKAGPELETEPQAAVTAAAPPAKELGGPQSAVVAVSIPPRMSPMPISF
jgi:hypothetical protein